MTNTTQTRYEVRVISSYRLLLATDNWFDAKVCAENNGPVFDGTLILDRVAGTASDGVFTDTIENARRSF